MPMSLAFATPSIIASSRLSGASLVAGRLEFSFALSPHAHPMGLAIPSSI